LEGGGDEVLQRDWGRGINAGGFAVEGFFRRGRIICALGGRPGIRERKRRGTNAQSMSSNPEQRRKKSCLLVGKGKGEISPGKKKIGRSNCGG